MTDLFFDLFLTKKRIHAFLFGKLGFLLERPFRMEISLSNRDAFAYHYEVVGSWGFGFHPVLWVKTSWKQTRLWVMETYRKIKEYCWNSYLETWPGNDKYVFWSRLNPYSKYVTIYDKWAWNNLFWQYYVAYTKRVWGWGAAYRWDKGDKKRTTKTLIMDILKVRAYYKNASRHFAKLVEIHERMS